MATVNNTPVVFAPAFRSESRSGQNSSRETKAQRTARVQALFGYTLESKPGSGKWKYLGQLLTPAAAKAIAENATIAIPALGIAALSITNKAAAKCTVCGGVHDLTNPKNSVKAIALQSPDGKTVVLSDTCRADYFGPMAAQVLAKDSAISYRNDFSKAKAR